MKTHIEYDDFGEFIEVLDDVGSDLTFTDLVGDDLPAAGKESLLRKVVRGFFLTLITLTAMFTTTSFASGWHTGKDFCENEPCVETVQYENVE